MQQAAGYLDGTIDAVLTSATDAGSKAGCASAASLSSMGRKVVLTSRAVSAMGTARAPYEPSARQRARGHLTLTGGERVRILEDLGGGWSYGEREDGECGSFLTSCVQPDSVNRE